MMALKQPLFIGKRNTGPDDQIPHEDREPADRFGGEESGGQRGATYQGDPNAEIDLLDDGDRPVRGGIRSGIALVAALAVFAVILWYAYDWGMGLFETTDLPVIVADTTPIKSRPEDPGGIEVPNQDVSVLNDPVPDPAKPQAERLLPPPETPPLPQAEAPPSAAAAEAEELLRPPPETTVAPAVPAPAAKVALPPATPEVAIGAEPEATPEAVLPAPEAAPDPVPLAAASGAATEAAPEPPETSGAQPAPEPTTPPAAAPRSETPPQAAAPVAAPAVAPAAVAAPAEAPAPAAPQAAAVPAAQTGGFVVQLVSIRSRDRARPSWESLQKAHPSLLGNRELSIQKADLGDRGIFYRIRAGFFAERASAGDLCNALKTRGQDCLVTKR